MAHPSTGSFTYVSHVTIKTTASNIKIEVVDCGGTFENRTLTRVSQTGSFNYFNATNLVAGETFTCLDLVVIEIDTASVTSYEAYIFQFYIMGCTSTTYSTSKVCSAVTELTGFTPGFPYDTIVIHSSSTDLSPTPVKPCEGSLFLIRAAFAEPMIITVILLNDDRRGSLAVNYIRIVGAVDAINLQYIPSFSNGSVITLPSDNITIYGDELEADISPIDMYAVRIVDLTKGTFHNITDVVIRACVLTAEILAGIYVNDSRLCETTSTTSTTSTTMTSTTSMTSMTSTTSTVTTPGLTTTTAITTPASTTALECCACTPVRPTISVQQAEERAEQLARELQVDVSTLSSTIRKKTSAKDERPSAKMVGSIGIIMLSLTLGLVVVLDADYIYKVVKMIQKWRRIQRKLKLAKEKSASASVEPEGHGKIENDTNQT
ncbi:uncharacterized protein LOC110448558 [Mizuhopecten yessoensis]|nr:uncharacterized protein LOC110448558 [Mizuhopecten yessoensis]